MLLTDDAAIRALNAQWRGIDKPTNVLSFPAAAAAGSAAGAIARRHRDRLRDHGARGATRKASRSPIISPISPCMDFSTCLGYDHDTDAAAETMEALERDILARLGVPDPYLTHETLRASAAQTFGADRRHARHRRAKSQRFKPQRSAPERVNLPAVVPQPAPRATARAGSRA